MGSEGPGGVGEEAGGPGGAVGEVEEEPGAMGADALDDLAGAVEEQDVGLPAAGGEVDAVDGVADEEVGEVGSEGVGLGAVHEGESVVRGSWSVSSNPGKEHTGKIT